MDIQKAIEKIAGLARASQCSMFDIVAYDTFSESVEVFEKKITNTEIQESKALGIRVFKNSCPGIAFTEKLTEDALKTCLADALSHTAITSPISFQLPKPTALIAKDFNRLSPDFNQYSFSDLIHFATKLEDNVRSADARIENVPYTGAGRSSVTVHFLNSEHVRHVHTDQDFSAYSAAVLSFEAQKKMGFYSNSRLSFSDLKNLPIAALTVERTLQQLGAKPVKAGKYRVLFS
ncbi:MAG TPA: hypothetical protein PLY93_14525, partial [Turneriella sp.]|nr:hypothetical protein [Turneriella sp.]